MLTATAGMAASLAGHRTITCSAARIAPQPPDLIRWVRREGGFVNPKLKISDMGAHGLCVVASEDIPEGSDLIALPSHLPLRFKKSPESDGDSALFELALCIPCIGFLDLFFFAFAILILELLYHPLLFSFH